MECIQTDDEWYFRSKYLTRFLDKTDHWKMKLSYLLDGGSLNDTMFYANMVSNQYYKVGCSLSVCDTEFYYYCSFQ